MKKKLPLVAVAGLVSMLVASAADAMPLAPPTDQPIVERVAGGCGPYARRGPWGRSGRVERAKCSIAIRASVTVAAPQFSNNIDTHDRLRADARYVTVAKVIGGKLGSGSIPV
jgi:hypothetical protein